MMTKRIILRSLSDAEGNMPVDVVNSIVINRPVADVSQYAANPDNAPLWYENIKSVEWKTRPPVQVGSQIDFVAQFLGRRLAYTYEVIEHVPGRRLTMRTPGPPFLMETTYAWEDDNGVTRMTLRNRGTPRGFSAWFAPLMSLMVGRANRKDLALLKRRLEGTAS
jgi:Polyketide cyclase / dehydrase and lipid transport